MAGIVVGPDPDAITPLFGGGPSLVERLAAAFPQSLHVGAPGRTVAQAAPPPTGGLSPDQWGLVGNLTSFGGILAGEGAATADLGALARAKGMAEAGHDAPSIWGQTGWFKGPEGRWKFEIDDSGAKLGAPQYGEPIKDTLEHPDLYAAYPQLAAGVRLTDQGSYGNAGHFHPAGENDQGVIGGLYLSPKTASGPDGLSTALHEMQHAVQGQEGFARGGNLVGSVVGESRPDFMRIYRETVGRMTDPGTLEDFARQAGYDSPVAASADYAAHVKTLQGYTKRGLPDWLDKAAQETAQRETYRRQGGEAESRAVEARIGMTPEQRRALFPLDSYDVPLDQLIMRGIQVGR